MDHAERLVDETSTAQQQVGDASHGRHDGVIEHIPEHVPYVKQGATGEAETLLEEKLRKDEGHDHWCQRCFEYLFEQRRLWWKELMPEPIERRTGLTTRGPQCGFDSCACTIARAGDDYSERSEQTPPSHPAVRVRLSVSCRVACLPNLRWEIKSHPKYKETYDEKVPGVPAAYPERG